MLGSVLGAASGILEGIYLEASRNLKSSGRRAAEEVDKAVAEKKAEEAAAEAAAPQPPPSSRPPLAPSAAPKQRSRGDAEDEANVAQLLPLLLLGPSGIGKTLAARAWASSGGEGKRKKGKPFSAASDAGGENAAPSTETVGADPYLRTMTLPDRRRVAVALWDCGGGGGEGEEGDCGEAKPSSSSPEDACAAAAALGEGFFAGARVVLLAYDSESSADERTDALLEGWLRAARAQLEGARSDGSPVFVVVGLQRSGAKEEKFAETPADEAAARWAARHSLRHFVGLGAAASAATLLALEESVSSASAATEACSARGHGDSASDAADVLGSLRCLGGGGIGETKRATAAPSSSTVSAGAVG